MSLSLVSTAQDSDLCLLAEQPDKIFHMRSLARTADGNVSDGYDGRREAPALQNIQFEELVPQFHSQSIEGAQRSKPAVYLYVVAFHLYRMIY